MLWICGVSRPILYDPAAVIRLRQALERGRRHPVLGPILLILLVLLLAMVFLHAAGEGHDAVTEVGAMCMVILTILGPLLLEKARRTPPTSVEPTRDERGPPQIPASLRFTWSTETAFAFVTPLRR